MLVPMLLPAAAVMVGSALGLRITPGRRVRSGLQHLAAGTVLTLAAAT